MPGPRPDRRQLLAALAAALPAARLGALPRPAAAAGRRVPVLVRDAEIEHVLGLAARPLLAAAGMAGRRVKVLMLLDRSLNAFVADERHVFVHTGLLLAAPGLEAVQAVLAHEIAHLAAGHLPRQRIGMAGAASAARAGVLLSLLVAAAAGSEAGAGVLAASVGGAQAMLLAHSRGDESAADALAAGYLAAAGIDPGALLELTRMMERRERLAGGGTPWLRTHPLWRERLTALERRVAELRRHPPASYARAWQEALVPLWARARAKLEGFTAPPDRILARPVRSDADRLARAVALHRQGRTSEALAALAPLLAAQPEDPWLHELRGQILLEAGRAAEAVGAYERARALAPDEPLLAAALGHALLARGRRGDLARARDLLEDARRREPLHGQILRDLARVHARLGEPALAALVAAEASALAGDWPAAAAGARRALAGLAEGSPARRRAEDLVALAEQMRARR
ncbi:MAG: peptidase M48 [Alphaproteobacteria bacterium]|nr:MAG: peptidase M48 [Alphaproteobacteria bacterium]